MGRVPAIGAAVAIGILIDSRPRTRTKQPGEPSHSEVAAVKELLEDLQLRGIIESAEITVKE